MAAKPPRVPRVRTRHLAPAMNRTFTRGTGTVLDMQIGLEHRRQIRIAAIVAAMATALVLRQIAVEVAGIEFVSTGAGAVGHDDLDVGIRPVLLVSGFACLAGWAVLEVLERLQVPGVADIWTAGAVVTLLASIAPLIPWNMAGETRGMLVLMHVAVAAVFIAVMRPTVASR